MKTITTFAQLRDLRDALGPKIRNVVGRIAERGASRLSDVARSHFESGEGPSGVPFGVSKVTGKPLTLRKTGALEKAATTYTATGSTIRASADSVPHARYQLHRGYLPGSMPAEFQAELDVIAQSEISATLGRVA